MTNDEMIKLAKELAAKAINDVNKKNLLVILTATYQRCPNIFAKTTCLSYGFPKRYKTGKR